jgi:uncharacterized protein
VKVRRRDTAALAGGPDGRSYVGHIPVIWLEPRQSSNRLAVWLPGGLGRKEDTLPRLLDLAAAGFVALSFDPWLHGERASVEPPDELFARAMGNFPRVVWPMIGQSALDVLAVIDWAIEELAVEPPCYIGGVSLGGDIAVAAAGLDERIGCVATMLATPDWGRPGMHVDGRLVPEGHPDAYAAFFYRHINPLTNLAGFARGPAIAFECGAEDDHVPADGALRFQAALRSTYESHPERLRVTLHPGAGHQSTDTMWENCVSWFHDH